MSPERPATAWRPTPLHLGLALAALGCAIRVHNALRYPPLHGFDAQGNWQYVLRLTRSLALPEPDEGWSTSHPPLFYYAAALGVRALRALDLGAPIVWVRLGVTAAGLGVVALAVALVRRADPGNARRAVLAGALLLFLPAHIMLSAMVSEELPAALLTSLAIVLAVWAPAAARPAPAALLAGAAGGLAALTKLSGALVVPAAALSYAVAGRARGARRRALTCVAGLALAAALAGGWYYAQSFIRHGFVYPHALPAHAIMFTMPPGERAPLDYVRLPLATFTDPQLLAPPLLRSVWGSTYATLWFDGHRFFLPRRSRAVTRTGTLLLLLALVPSAAFAVGLARGARRALGGEARDAALLALVLLTFAGYTLFTWRNPWFATLKGSYLLGLSVPFAYYASEVLDAWTRGSGARAVALRALLGLLVVTVAFAFSYGLVFDKPEPPGLPWLGAGVGR